MYLYFGMKFENDRWNVGTAILSSRNEIAECIRMQQEMYPDSAWIIGSCRKADIESSRQYPTTAAYISAGRAYQTADAMLVERLPK